MADPTLEDEDLPTAAVDADAAADPLDTNQDGLRTARKGQDDSDEMVSTTLDAPIFGAVADVTDGD